MKKDVRHVWTIGCRKSLIDSDSNILNLMEILEKITVGLQKDVTLNKDIKINIPINFEIVSFWQKLVADKAVKGKAKILMLSPSGKELLDLPIEFDVPKNKKNMRTILKINTFPFVGAGLYKIIMFEKDENAFVQVAEVPIEIVTHESEKSGMGSV